MRIDDTFPSLPLFPTIIVIAVLAAALQLSGVWATMLIAGVFAGLFTRTHRKAFIAGFAGVALAWTAIFIHRIISAQAMEIATFFIGLLGLSIGWLVIVISVILGAMLGGFGGFLGRALIEMVDEIMMSRKTAPNAEPIASTEEISDS
ncbi:MAG: hypothetical protein ACFFED_01785 [Candidatus Thorarchaeota archaeon]